MRANPLLWRLAEWMYSELVGEISWNGLSQGMKNGYYDKASVLYGKVINNDFTSEDNHKD